MLRVMDFGIRDYEEILQIQERLFYSLVSSKKSGQTQNEYILIGEHYPVITLGRRGKEDNILVGKEILDKEGVGLYHIGRGGDVTYHCPGQLIVYPIFDMEKHGIGVKEYVNILEESIIRLLNKYGIQGKRVDGATGVWVAETSGEERKICAMGIKCNRFCCMHGLALNVNSNLEGFKMINPCGFIDKGVTSMYNELHEKSIDFSDSIKELNIQEIKKEFLHIFLSLVFPFEEVFHFTE